MFYPRRAPLSCALFVFLFFLVAFSAENVAASTITGIVFDQNRNPLQRIDVELLSENYIARLRTKTDGSGRYQFSNIGDGRYYVRVLPFRTNLEDQTKEVIIQTLSLRFGSGNAFFTQDFYLKPKRGGLGDTTNSVVFAQEVPNDAELLYKLALEDFSDKKRVNGRKKLIKALKIFPNYYTVLQTLGIELLSTREYTDAAKLFMHAAQVNPRSSRAFYYMGFAFNKLGKKYNKSALASLKKAKVLAPASFEVAFLAGKIERQSGNYRVAEKELLRAKKLSPKPVPEIHIELAQLYGNDLEQYGKAAKELELYLRASKKKDKNIQLKIADLKRKAKST